MEVAFSTDPAWRRRGLARALGHAVTALAVHRGIGRIVACCHLRNRAMRCLFDAFDAETECDAGEVSAAWVCRKAGPDRSTPSLAPAAALH